MKTATLSTQLSYAEEHSLNSNPTVHIEASTLEYLNTSYLLWEYKNNYSKREYRELLESYGWDKGSER